VPAPAALAWGDRPESDDLGLDVICSERQRRFGVDVKIGVTDTGRELVVSSTSNPDEIEALISESLKNPLGTLVLVDEKGRRVIVPSARIGYVEIAPADGRRVGFSYTA
jgi:hypothetical protein